MPIKTTELKPGVKAPEIKLETDAGDVFQLSKHKGKTVIVYFYPKANTPGCTTEACEFRDHIKELEEKDAVVVGISPDPPQALANFKKKYGLPFPLLADVDHSVAEAYGVWKEKSMYGKKYMGIERTTYVIGPDGKIRNIYNKVKPAGHATQILADLSS
jgi:peroxiredoxin Q/BCP